MATTSARRGDPDQVVLLNVSWEAYAALCGSLGDAGRTRLTFDGETLEIISPGSKHERLTARFGLLLSTVSIEWGVNIESTRSTRFTSDLLRGFEADESYYIASAAKVHNWDNIDLAVDPPPDLVIEVDVSNRRMDKKNLYARIGISEFWRYDERDGLEAFALVGGTYREIDVSLVIVGLPLAQIAARIAQTSDSLTIARAWRDWLRANRHLGGDSE